MNDSSPDPIRRAAELITAENSASLEFRLKQDIFNSIRRIKPATTVNVDFTTEVLQGDFFASLPAPLQGIAIARCEGALAFYNRVGWHEDFLNASLDSCVPTNGIDQLEQRYHAQNLHDLAYVHPKHFEKILGKSGAATLWENLKQFSSEAIKSNKTP